MEVREGCGPLELSRRRRGRIPLRTSLSQIPLKSFGFPGAESARKRFFLRGASPHSEEISARGRPTEIFDFAWSVAKRLACPLGKQPFRRAGRRPRLEVERVHTLSSSPGAVLVEILVSDEAGYSFVDVVSDDTGRGVLRSPTPPWGTGARGLRALSRSPRWGTNGDFWMGKGGFVLLLFLLLFWRRILFPTTRGWGVLLPYIPLGDGVREGCAPSRVLRGGGRTEIFWMGKGES